jgi:hypothetical protein
MLHVCDAPDGKTWFRLETDMEAQLESEHMGHAVAKHFGQHQERAKRSYRPPSTVSFEQNIGLKVHLLKEMPIFLTLRNMEGEGLVTAMLPPGGQDVPGFQCVIVGAKNDDPYDAHEVAIDALASFFLLRLERKDCYPYRR